MRSIFKLVIIIFCFCRLTDTISAEQFIYDGHGKRNPFVSPAEAAPIAVEEKKAVVVDTSNLESWLGMNLAGIIWDEKAPYAIIGDSIVSIGDEVRGCSVLEVKPDSIVFQYKQKRFEVSLEGEAKEN